MKRSREQQEAPPLGIVIAASSAAAMMDVLESLCLRERGEGVQQIEMGEALLARLELRLADGAKVRVQGWLRAPDFDDVSALPFRGAGAACFVMEVEMERLPEAHAALVDFVARSKALGHDLLDRPFLLQYHGVDRHPGFDAAACGRWLGLPEQAGLRAESAAGVSFEAGLGLERLMAEISGAPAGSGKAPEERQMAG